MDTLIAVAGVIVSLVGVGLTWVYARDAARDARASLKLQQAEVARREELERPGLTTEFEIEGGQLRVSIVHARAATFPAWDIVSASTLGPDVAMLRVSVEGMPSGPTVAKIERRERLQIGPAGAPVALTWRFFVVWNVGPGHGPAAMVRLHLERMSGETWHLDFDVPRRPVA